MAYLHAQDLKLVDALQALTSVTSEKDDLHLAHQLLRLQFDSLAQSVSEGGGGGGMHEAANPRDFEMVKGLREECERVTAECVGLQDGMGQLTNTNSHLTNTNSQLTRKLSASLKNKVELEKVQGLNAQLQLKVSHASASASVCLIYIYMYIYIYICTHLCVYAYTCAYLQICMCALYVHMHMYTNATHSNMFLCVYL